MCRFDACASRLALLPFFRLEKHCTFNFLCPLASLGMFCSSLFGEVNSPQDVAPFFSVVGDDRQVVAGLHRDQSPAFRLEASLDKAFYWERFFAPVTSISYYNILVKRFSTFFRMSSKNIPAEKNTAAGRCLAVYFFISLENSKAFPRSPSTLSLPVVYAITGSSLPSISFTKFAGSIVIAQERS